MHVLKSRLVFLSKSQYVISFVFVQEPTIIVQLLLKIRHQVKNLYHLQYHYSASLWLFSQCWHVSRTSCRSNAACCALQAGHKLVTAGHLCSVAWGQTTWEQALLPPDRWGLTSPGINMAWPCTPYVSNIQDKTLGWAHPSSSPY